ncbi:MAG: phosphatase PAP2 family protein [Ilumatobacteraceae bacterium]
MQVAEPDTEPEPEPEQDPDTGHRSGSARTHRLFWWKEALIMVAFYLVYSSTRNMFGSNQIAADGVPDRAFDNAIRVIDWERAIGTFHEESIQDWFLSHTTFLQFWNTYYGVAHFAVTLAVFIVLFVRRPDVLPQHRNSLAVMTAVAIVGFALFPLMPPRLLDEPCPRQVPPGEVAFGGACIPSEARGLDGFGFVDTLEEYGGPWSFDSETVASISNQYAAMPSMHIGWSAWSVIAIWPLLRRRWSRVVWLLYPFATLFCIIVTGNHYWIDGVGGLLALGIGISVGFGLHRWNQDRLDRRAALATS